MNRRRMTRIQWGTRPVGFIFFTIHAFIFAPVVTPVDHQTSVEWRYRHLLGVKMLHLKDFAAKLLVNAVYASDDETLLKNVINTMQQAGGGGEPALAAETFKVVE